MNCRKALALWACAASMPACFTTTLIEPSADSSGGSSSSGGKLGSGGAAVGGAIASGGSSVKGGSSGLGGSVTSSGGRSGSGGAAASSGGSSALGGAVTSSGGASSGGSADGISWLTFAQSEAPAELAPNADFGVDGLLYGYADSCASLTWDPVTRCASGTLCNAGATFANWGVAVGFDFRNSGKDGSPPNTKRTWNPNDFGVRGVAWEIEGTAPALQLWVLNMDPSYGGVCSSMSCDIAGPPDGTPNAPLASLLTFSNMRKDDWGGSGIVYSFDPAAVHALQFKLPAIVAGAAPFSFCILRVGLVR
ncbi:MAG: hypothetical protein QM756_46750 [Polyangiaceae bacterium]